MLGWCCSRRIKRCQPERMLFHLTRADALSTIFAGANLTGANLVGMNYANEGDYSDVIWSNTICPDGTNSNNDRKTCVLNGA